LIIGSYVPIVFVLLVIISLYWSFAAKAKIHRRLIRFWAILLILWGAFRFGVWLIFEIDSDITESHIREQFGLFQHLLSLLMLVLGILIIKRLKTAE